MGTTLKFYINTFKKSKRDNRYPIYLRIIHNLKKSEGKISVTPIKVSELNCWVEESQRFGSNHKKFLEHNILLNKIQNEYHNYIRDNITKMSDRTPHEIRDYLLSRNETDNVTLFEDAISISMLDYRRFVLGIIGIISISIISLYSTVDIKGCFSEFYVLQHIL